MCSSSENRKEKKTRRQQFTGLLLREEWDPKPPFPPGACDHSATSPACWDLSKELEPTAIYPNSPAPFPSWFLKTTKSVQAARWIWGISKSPIFLAGTFSTNTPFFALDSWHFRLWCREAWGTLSREILANDWASNQQLPNVVYCRLSVLGDLFLMSFYSPPVGLSFFFFCLYKHLSLLIYRRDKKWVVGKSTYHILDC